MGRYKIPTKIKEMQGTLEKSRVLGDEVEYSPVDEMPKPPETLDEYGAEVWQIATEELFDKGLLFITDLPSLEQYCIAVQHAREAALKLKDRSLVVRNPNEQNKPMINPYFKVLNESRLAIIKFSALFGFSPVSKTNIALGVVNEGKNMSLLK